MAAFDRCLAALGIGNVNVIYLSSVIPPGASVEERVGSNGETRGWGDRLYVVAAQHRTSTPGHEAWAGLSWAQAEPDRRGLFAEAHGASEAEVRFELTETMSDMTSRRSDIAWPTPNQAIIGITCRHRPVCALVVAVYASEPW